MTMKIEAQKLEAFCSIMNALIRESRLNITADGINTQAVDTANVALVRATIPATAFTEFRVEPGIVGMDIVKWKGAIGVMKSDAMVTLDTPANGKITLSGGGYDYKILPLDCNTIRKEPTVPSFQLPNELVIDSKEFAEAIRALGIISDKVLISIKDATLSLAAEGDTDHLRKDIPGEKTAKKNEIEARSLFSLDYLREITKNTKGAEKVTVCLGIDHPVRLDFMVGEIEASYVIAPRIEQEGA